MDACLTLQTMRCLADGNASGLPQIEGWLVPFHDLSNSSRHDNPASAVSYIPPDSPYEHRAGTPRMQPGRRTVGAGRLKPSSRASYSSRNWRVGLSTIVTVPSMGPKAAARQDVAEVLQRFEVAAHAPAGVSPIEWSHQLGIFIGGELGCHGERIAT